MAEEAPVDVCCCHAGVVTDFLEHDLVDTTCRHLIEPALKLQVAHAAALKS